MVSRNPLSDGVNDEITTALKRAYERSSGRSVRGEGERVIRAALKRIERNETTIEMEMRKMTRKIAFW